MEIEGLCFPDDLYYDEHHQWARAAGDTVTIGLTAYAQSVAGDVVFVDLPARGVAVGRGDAFASFESGKWVGRIYAPVGGVVVEVNGHLLASPRTINKDPYGEGWIARIRARDPQELQQLMRGEATRAFVQAELDRDRAAGAAPGGADGEP